MSRYTAQDRKDILTTAVEGGINYWAYVGDHLRDDDLSWVCVVLHPVYDGDFKPTTVDYVAVGKAIDRIRAGEVQINGEIIDAVKSGDPGMIDATAADAIVQVAAHGKVVYG